MEIKECKHQKSSPHLIYELFALLCMCNEMLKKTTTAIKLDGLSWTLQQAEQKPNYHHCVFSPRGEILQAQGVAMGAGAVML